MEVDLYQHKDYNDIYLIVPTGTGLDLIEVKDLYSGKPDDTVHLKKETEINDRIKKNGYSVENETTLKEWCSSTIFK